MLIYNIHSSHERVIILSVGENIKNRRVELRISQQQLADLMGYKTRSTIAKIECGENDVSQKKLQKFAAVLDTTVEQLLLDRFTQPTSAIPISISPSGKTKNIVVILAGGINNSDREKVPNQFINVYEKPIIVYTMLPYQSHPAIDDIYVVCPKGWERIISAYAQQHGITKLKGLICAGVSGTASLKNALDHLVNLYSSDDLMIIQESTRPFITVNTISALLQACSEKDSATMCYLMKDYVQFDISQKKSKYIDRNTIIAMQSPEAHRLHLLKTVFEKANDLNHPLIESCCTMLMYNLGFDVNFIESNINNIKIANTEDISVLSAFVKK